MKVAAVQFAPIFKGVEENTQTVIETLARLARDGVRLVIFPEAFITGYCFDSAEEAGKTAIEGTSEPLQQIAGACAENDIYAIVGYAENDEGSLYNSARVIGPRGFIGNYHKTHLPFLGYDRFVKPGADLPIFEIDDVKIGIMICFDVRFPEAARVYSLKGADLLCVPTNWPEFAEPSSDLVCPTRAIENHVYVAAASRVGEECGVKFVGRSKIIDPYGKVLAAADHRDEAIITAEIDPGWAREKTIVNRPGEYELALFDSRIPDLYKRISE